MVIMAVSDPTTMLTDFRKASQNFTHVFSALTLFHPYIHTVQWFSSFLTLAQVVGYVQGRIQDF